MPHLLNALYLAAFTLALPWLAYRRVVLKKDRGGWGGKLFGRLPVISERQRPGCSEASGTLHPRERLKREVTVWIHAVSVGEVLQLPGLIKELRRRRPGVRFVLTVGTATGYAVAHRKFPDLPVHRPPLDFTWAVRNAVRRVRPDLLVLVELEVWPNLVRAADAAGVPVAVVNGRLSENSFRGYRRLRPVLRGTFARLSLVAAQTDEYAARFAALGTPADRVAVTGSIKYDGVRTDRDDPRVHALRRAFGLHPDEPVLVAGSTGDPEEEIVLDAHARLRPEFPALRLLIVPRHKERFDAVARLVTERGETLLRRSDTAGTGDEGPETGETIGGVQHPTSLVSGPSSPVPPTPVLLLDTLGELSAAWGLATVAFVGGSLNDRGGQNVLEPAGYAAAVLFGPNTRNFRDITDRLLAADAAAVVTDAANLATTAATLLRDGARRTAMGERARDLVLANRGATAETADRLCGLLPGERAAVAA